MDNFFQSARPWIANNIERLGKGMIAADREDLTQEASLRLLRMKERLRPNGVHACIAKIVLNLIRDKWRRERGKQALPLYAKAEDGGEIERQIPVPDPAEEFINNSFSEPVQKALEALNQDFRRTVELIDIRGHSYKSAAIKMGVGEQTVRSRLHRGRKALRALIEKYQNASKGLPPAHRPKSVKK
ncbi:sigma-70 family RNA polymerase sigma factor [Candidatus Micrarchaeota archaeon]|nr:sigma-70 family RNA polymerase sigma factor [Candidatus Micrarchaeota archaeon]